MPSIDSDGYIRIYSPKHPFKQSNGYVTEHRLVIEKKLGRFLRKDEVVHHVNSIKNDNREENLVVLTKSQHHIIHAKETKIYGCKINWCDRKHKSRGLCNRHYYRKLYDKIRTKPINPRQCTENKIYNVCEITGCKFHYRCGGFCKKHYKRPGVIKKHN